MRKNVILLILLFFLFSLNCSSSPEKKPGINFDNIFRKQLGGLTRTSPIKEYPADSLYNYLDGAADEYIAYGIIKVISSEYAKDDFNCSIDLFDFSDKLGAFGIYAKRRLPTDNYIDLGTESLIGNSYVYYFKDRFFMTVNTYGRGLPELGLLSDLAAAVDSVLPGDGTYPDQIMVFPQKRLVTHSEKFYPHGLESFAAPESCFTADYKKGRAVCTLFYAANRSQLEYDTFVEVIGMKCRILTHTAKMGNNSIYAVSDTEGKILAGYSHGIIFGVLNVSGDYWARALCSALFDNLGLQI